MRMSIAAVALLVGFGVSAAKAQEFQHEASPLFENCGDASYETAKANGITVGISPSPPFTSLNPDTQKAEGLEVEIDEAAIKWAGIDKIKYEVMPFGQLIPALLSKRIDMVAALHITPDRKKVISFGGPAYWYGPGILVKTGNPDGIKSFDDLKGKQIGADVVPFQTDAEQFSAVSTGRVSAIVDDDTKISLFLGSTKDGAMELLKGIAVPQELIFTYGYGYVRPGLRKEDCSLRAAISQGLSEARGNGNVLALLKKYGFSEANLFFFPLK
mgnify:CR=1 FL=1